MTAATRAEGATSIPAHSCILAAWVFSGILGVPFWIAVLIIHVLIYRSAINQGHPQFVLLASYLLADGLWHIFFSPLGYARFPWPPLFAVCIILYSQATAKVTSEDDFGEERLASPALPAFA